MRNLLHSVVAAAIIAPVPLSGCGTTSPTVAQCAQVLATRKVDQAAPLLGQWRDEDAITYTFRYVADRVRLISVVAPDNEVFEVRSADFIDGYFAIEYYVRSTGYTVNVTLIRTAGVQLPATWYNSREDAGRETFTRVN